MRSALATLCYTLGLIAVGGPGVRGDDKADVENTGLFKFLKPMASMDVAKAGYEAMRRGRRVAIVGLQNKLTAQAVRVSPRLVVTKVARALQEKR